MKFLTLCMSLATVAAASEKVWLRELDIGEDKRGIKSSSLQFELRRSGGVTKLELQENQRVNANAPVFVIREDSQGNKRLVKQMESPNLKTRFYHDKRNNGSFQVRIDERNQRRTLSGSLRLDNDWYELSSVPQLLPAPKSVQDIPFLLKKETLCENKEPGENDEVDEVKQPDPEIPALIKKLKRILNMERQVIYGRDTGSNPVYAVEVLIAVDPSLWNKFYKMTSASGGMDQDQATEMKLREHLVHIISGISLRYESIDDNEINIYLTVTGFLFYKTVDSSNPLPPDTDIIEQNGKLLVSADTYLSSIREWLKTLSDLPNNDHVMVMTDYDIYGSKGPSVAGMAYVGGACLDSRVSINENGGYFRTVSVMAHELGHNLGSGHDGNGDSKSCPPADKYIMAPSVANFREDEAYTANPWTFSSCSITAFKKYFSALGDNNCLLDKGDYFDEAEFNSHLKMLPGQLHTATQQCQLERGPTSKLCDTMTPPTAADFCRRMACAEGSSGYCYFYTPARGTDCGETGANTYCIDGQCVAKSDEHYQQSKEGVTGQTPTENNAGGDIGTCVDIGDQGKSCSWLDNYFYDTYNAGPDQWCRDPNWAKKCCAYCLPYTMMKRSCTDVGISGLTCKQFADSYPSPPSSWCQEQELADKCCSMCQAYTAKKRNECIDVGMPKYNWTCKGIAESFLQSEEYKAPPSEWCLKSNWKKKCCAMCKANGVE